MLSSFSQIVFVELPQLNWPCSGRMSSPLSFSGETVGFLNSCPISFIFLSYFLLIELLKDVNSFVIFPLNGWDLRLFDVFHQLEVNSWLPELNHWQSNPLELIPSYEPYLQVTGSPIKYFTRIFLFPYIFLQPGVKVFKVDHSVWILNPRIHVDLPFRAICYAHHEVR